MAEIDYLNDCLTECARIETARNNCIAALNSIGFTTPLDASLGMLPHYFGCDSLIGPDASTKTFANIDDASAAISLVQTKKNNLKTMINRFCKPYNVQITNQTIDEYYPYISMVTDTYYQVEYLTNTDSSCYIDLGYALDRTYKINATVSWDSLYPFDDYNILFGSHDFDASIGNRLFGITGHMEERAGGMAYCADYTFFNRSRTYVSQDMNLGNRSKMIFTNCYISQENAGYPQTSNYEAWINGTINSTTLNNKVTEIGGRKPNSITSHCMIFNNFGYCPINSRFYSASVYNSSGQLLHSYIPVITWAGCGWAPGVKDTVTNTIHYNSGSGYLGYGPIVTT